MSNWFKDLTPTLFKILLRIFPLYSFKAFPDLLSSLSKRSLPALLADDVFWCLSWALIAALALLVTTKLSHAGSTAAVLLVSISTVWPLSNWTFNGAYFLFILQPTKLLPISVWTSYAKSTGVDPVFKLNIWPLGEKT